MLAGNGFKKVSNLSGGIKAWNGETAFGGEMLGLELFSGNESTERTLTVAYSLEQGLRDFYLSMLAKVQNQTVQNLFQKLAEIELQHQEGIFAEYQKIAKEKISREEFESAIVVKAVEGGLTTEEYVHLFQPDWNSPSEVVAVAISIEAQALDLYLRAANRAMEPTSKKFLLRIAGEEQAHLRSLGVLMEGL